MMSTAAIQGPHQVFTTSFKHRLVSDWTLYGSAYQILCAWARTWHGFPLRQSRYGGQKNV